MAGESEYWLFIFHNTVNGHSSFGEEKGREICSEFVILSVSSTIYRLLGTSLGVTVFEIGCSLFRAQDVTISIRHIAQHYISWGFSLYPSVDTHCSCLPYRS